MKLAAAFAVLALAASAVNAASAPSPVALAIADPSRPKDDRAADAVRDPVETLNFAGVKPGMKVGEFFPGGGYYSRLLLDVVGPKGRVYGLENAGWKGAVKDDQTTAAAHANFVLDAEPFGQFSAPEKLDLIWITQNYHDLHIAKYGVVDMADFNRRVFAALKPGGIYFVLDHQANPGTTDAQISDLHRIEKATVISEVTAAGFKLVAEGKFLAQPGDDHSKTVFDPAIRGHTDQYALKFAKPQS
jgi:predicted methyltransferase